MEQFGGIREKYEDGCMKRRGARGAATRELPSSADLDSKLWEKQCGGITGKSSRPENLQALSCFLSG